MAIVLLAVIALFVALFLFSLEGVSWSPRLALIGAALLVIGCFAGWVFTHKTVNVRPDSILLDLRGNIVKIFLQDQTVWKKEYIDYAIVPFKKTGYELKMEVTPITPNPKVRKIIYEVALEIPAETVDALYRVRAWVREKFKIPHFPSAEELRKRFEYELYEFNDKRSTDLAVFSNPLDQGQQVAFKQLLLNFLSNRAPHEVVVTKAKFTLA